MAESPPPPPKRSRTASKGKTAATTSHPRSTTGRPSSAAAGRASTGRGAFAAASAAGDPSLVLPQYFSNLNQEERYLAIYKNKSIIEPKHLDLKFFEDEHFECIELISSLGLSNFLSLEKPYYPTLVRMFYSNLEIRNGCIYSEVKKIPIVIDAGLFYQLTNLPSDGAPFCGQIIDDWKLDYNSLDAKKMISIEGTDCSGRLFAGSLGLENRLLHYIYVRTLCPRQHNLAQLNEGDIMVLWALLTGRPIDWANLVRSVMVAAKPQSEPLPFASLITCFLQHFDVPLEGEEMEKCKRNQAIGATTLSRMGFRKRHGEWISSKAPQPVEASERTPSPPPPPPPHITQILDGIRDLRVYMGEQFAGVGQRFDHLGYRVDCLEGSIGSLRRHFDLPDYVHPIPPPLAPEPSTDHPPAADDDET